MNRIIREAQAVELKVIILLNDSLYSVVASKIKDLELNCRNSNPFLVFITFYFLMLINSIAFANNEGVLDFVKRENAPTCLLTATEAVAKTEPNIGDATAKAPIAVPAAILPILLIGSNELSLDSSNKDARACFALLAVGFCASNVI